MSFKEERNKKSYHARRKRIYDTLREFGISIGLAKRIVYRYPLRLLEKLIKETEKRQPSNSANYFLNGLKRSRIKYGDSRKRDRKRKFGHLESNKLLIYIFELALTYFYISFLVLPNSYRRKKV